MMRGGGEVGEWMKRIERIKWREKGGRPNSVCQFKHIGVKLISIVNKLHLIYFQNTSLLAKIQRKQAG